MLPFVTQVGRSQKSIQDGVRQNIAIAMARQTSVVGDVYATQYQAPAGLQQVGVEPYANAKIHSHLPKQ